MDIILKPIESLLWAAPAIISTGVGHLIRTNKKYINNVEDNFVDFSDNIPERKEVHYDISYFENKMNEQLKAKENKGE